MLASKDALALTVLFSVLFSGKHDSLWLVQNISQSTPQSHSSQGYHPNIKDPSPYTGSEISDLFLKQYHQPDTVLSDLFFRALFNLSSHEL